MLGSGDLWVTELVMTYDGKPSYVVSIMEFDAGQVIRESQYFGDPFDPGPSRAQWVERMGTARGWQQREASPMTPDLPEQALELRSLVTPQGTLELSLRDVPVAPPAANQVLVRVEASPINPSDLGVFIPGAECPPRR